MNRFVHFDRMITPTIIKFIFWVGVVFSIIVGLIQIFAGIASPFAGGIQVFLGLLTIVLGPLCTRIYCELLMIWFKMHEALQEIKENTKS